MWYIISVLISTYTLYLCRLKREYQQLQKSPPSGVNIYLPSESDLYTWEALIDGPDDSLYNGKLSFFVHSALDFFFALCAPSCFHIPSSSQCEFSM